MRSSTLIPVVAVSAVLFLMPNWQRASDPSFNRDTGPAGVESFEAGCRVCHDAGVPDRHHLLFGSPIAQGSVVPYPDTDGNGLADFAYGCLSCHDAAITVVRDCVTCHGSPAGMVPDGAVLVGSPVTVTRTPAGDLTLSWDPSCGMTDTDYAVYVGTLGDFASHAPLTCSTAGGLSATFAPAAGSAYYLVVARNHWSEGSYGIDADGVQRLPSAAACLAQSIGCPWP